VLAVLALAVIASVVWTSRAVADGWALLTHRRVQAVYVDPPRRELQSNHR
jgi:hypothetical protein